MQVPPTPPLTGFAAIEHALSKLNLDDLELKAREDLKGGKKTRRAPAIRTLQVIEGLRSNSVQPSELMISKIPVIPPLFRPFAVAGDTFIPGESNELYKDLIQYKDFYNQLHKDLGDEGTASTKYNLYRAVRSVYGFGEPVNPKTKSRGVSGFLDQILGGGSPKFSVFQRRLFSKTQDSVSRGVATAGPDMEIDEIGIPQDAAWKMYAPYIQRRLVRMGMSAPNALSNVSERTEQAKKALEYEMKERPVIYSRAPAWHKYNVLAAWPKLLDGDNIQTNSYVAAGLNLDHDGDTLNIHLPSLPESVEEAKNKLMPSKMLMSIKSPDTIVPALKHEQVLGLYSAKKRPSAATHKFSTEDEAMEAIRGGKIRLSDEIEIGGPPVKPPKAEVPTP